MATETFEFTMPSLGADMDEGKLVEWLVKPGDQVTKGDIVAVVETAKAIMEVECFRDGVVQQFVVQPGATVPVGAPLAVLTAAGAPAEAASAPFEAQTPALEVARTAEQAPRAATHVPPAPAEAAPAARPSAPSGPLIRRLADQLGVDLATVHGTGRGGVIRRGDVRRAAGTQVAPASTTRLPPSAPAPPRAAPAANISPYARELADRLGVDISTVHGTGRGGAIRADDVRAAAEPGQATQPEPPERPAAVQEPDAAARRAQAARLATARLMARSKREIPHYYLRTTVDVTDALALIRERNRELPVGERILPAALFLRSTAIAAEQVPALNGFWEDDRFVPAPSINLGVPVSLRGGGLITPALTDAAGLKLPELAVRMRELATRAKAGRLRGSELTGATITVTNLGDLGVELVYGVIYPPQVALVGVGRIVERPWAVDGLLGIRSVATVTLSADHRASDGATGARFLDVLGRSLSQPENL
ncbi:MAG TPA: dihydrolipoamide acetyltransferase family protein [Jiangellales bacterium]|nr:dihydrolipoamide acetyltransferase family protein [Jiangellales bacterium]